MAVAPTSFASSLIAALRGGIGDTGSASTVSLLPNMAPNYSGAAMFNPTARTGNINNVQPFAPMPYVAPSQSVPKQQTPINPPYFDVLPDGLELQTISYPISMPSLMKSEPIQQQKTPSVEVYEVPVSDTPAVQTDPIENFELDRDLGLVQQSDVMEPVSLPSPITAQVEPVAMPTAETSTTPISIADAGVPTAEAVPDLTLDALIEEVLATEQRPESYYQVQTTDPTVAEPNPYQELFELLKFANDSPKADDLLDVLR